MMMAGMGEPWTRGTPIAWITPEFSSKTGTRNARKCCQDLLFFPHHGLHQPVLQHHRANQLPVKILEEWLHGVSEHNKSKVRGRELVHLLLLHAAIWVEEVEIGSLILER
jgi:hypothetical protein